ncbi:hypothetical protein CJ030_MR5G015877 [Morella rubra]|uniref:Uncharacterized protein n=1 Tax=Morella rubra TaxID=262757 RepID=A0A6A1VKK2_9ROSI|nr:hypothetical protein CJ030_MR5G015877 [Morella rubra]
MSQQRETNPYFIRPFQPQQRIDQQSKPLSPLVRQPGHQDRNSEPVGLQKSEPLHQVQLQPHRPRVGDQPSQPSGPWAPRLQHQGQTPQPHGDRLHHQQPHGPKMPRTNRTHPFAWFAAVFCAIFWVVIIVGGLIVLIVYLVFRPRSPGFDVSTATLNAAYLDMGYLLNADVTLLANFTNPNKKVSVDYSFMYIDLYYGSTLIASQYIPPFSAAKTETKFANIHMVTSQVRLPLEESRRLQRQMENNGVILEVKGSFRARSNLGSILRYSYWLHGQCIILTASPPDGVLIRRKCKTKR